MAAMKPSVLFVQNRTHRAGAQTCLARLLRHETVRQWNPAVVCSPGGWLVEECRRIGVPIVEMPFPRSRSLAGRLFGNAAFARRVERALAERSIRPAIVHANDHQEGLLGLAVAGLVRAKSAIFLRSSAMTAADFRKYRCDRNDVITVSGDELAQRVRSWTSRPNAHIVRDGIFADEILPPRGKAPAPPTSILVIGTADPAKGWGDLVGAACLLEQQGFPPLRLDFTGKLAGDSSDPVGAGRLTTARCNFLGRVEAFRDLVRGYDLVINPSRMETFGMAAVEVLAAGVPLLSSRTGIIERVQPDSQFLFEPSNPESLAACLCGVLKRWSTIDFGIERSQALIREHLLIDDSAAELDRLYSGLTARRI